MDEEVDIIRAFCEDQGREHKEVFDPLMGPQGPEDITSLTQGALGASAGVGDAAGGALGTGA